MTKMHFDAIAAALRTMDPAARYAAAQALCPVFKRFNPAFDLDKFLLASNVLQVEARDLNASGVLVVEVG